MLTADQIVAKLPDVAESPADRGRLEFIVIRPTEGERELRQSVYISAEHGVEGDRWLASRWLTLTDGAPDPRVQVSLMNARILRLISGATARIALAGDNLVVDFDMSEGNVKPGQHLAVGESVVEISNVAHTGCAKFMSRYGRDAVRFINSAEGKRLHLRGLYARVVTPGLVRVGDTVSKVPA